MVSEPEVSASGYPLSPPTPGQHQKLVAALTPEQHQVTQKSGTEAPFCGGHLAEKKPGVYACIVCQLPLFRSEHKFDSGTGWPSFFETFDRQHVRQNSDESHGMIRIEITCARCEAHLGHVFPDGPPPTGTRHCLNSMALRFYPEGQSIPHEISDEPMEDTGSDRQMSRAWFGGG